jgi:hypothetical protein
MIAQSRLSAARHAWHWSLITAVLAAGAAILNLTGSPTPRHVVLPILVCVMAWCSAAVQRWAFKTALSTQPSA